MLVWMLAVLVGCAVGVLGRLSSWRVIWSLGLGGGMA